MTLKRLFEREVNRTRGEKYLQTQHERYTAELLISLFSNMDNLNAGDLAILEKMKKKSHDENILS